MGTIDWKFLIDTIPQILEQGLLNTIKLSLVAFFFACIIGLVVALIKISKAPVLSQICVVYTSFFRGTPLMVQILIFYYGIPMFLNRMNASFGWNINVNGIPAIVFMYVNFSLCYGAYISEVMRSALLSVDKGQLEAGYTIGMNKPQVFNRVVFPQALSNAVPNLENYFIDIVKGTSLAFTATVVEVLAAAKIIGGRSYRYFEAYMAAALIYWVICIILEFVFKKIEKYFRRHERRI